MYLDFWIKFRSGSILSFVYIPSIFFKSTFNLYKLLGLKVVQVLTGWLVDRSVSVWVGGVVHNEVSQRLGMVVVDCVADTQSL